MNYRIDYYNNDTVFWKQGPSNINTKEEAIEIAKGLILNTSDICVVEVIKFNKTSTLVAWWHTTGSYKLIRHKLYHKVSREMRIEVPELRGKMLSQKIGIV